MKNLLNSRNWLASCIALVGLFICPPQLAVFAQSKGGSLSDEQVSVAIEKIKKYFYDTQDEKTSGWFGRYHESAQAPANRDDWGPTSMAVLALIVSGESPQNPKLAKAIDLLTKKEITGVYAMSMRVHVWSYLPKDIYGGVLTKDSDAMFRSWYDLSKFDYLIAPVGEDKHAKKAGRVDNSTTQYGVLAMWQASKCGLSIPKSFWQNAMQNFFNMQNPDGGWTYGASAASKPSMTLSGLVCLMIAQQELFRGQSKPDPKITAAIEKGLAYLDKNFDTGDGGAHSGAGYTWYGYERVGLACGRKYFGNKDWFQEIAQKIVARDAQYGARIHEAAFDLMFLARGRVPVWINKLQIEGAAWNNRPNDIYFLNNYISEFREHEINWQVVDIESSPADWIAAPLMWFSSDAPLSLGDAQVAKIKQYLDMGGTLILNAESGGSTRQSFEELAAKMYPSLKFERMQPDHPMANLLEGDERSRKAPPIKILSNGARVLMVIPDDDWGMTFQSDEKPDPTRTDAWRYIVNIYGVATDRGELTPRLTSPIIARQQRSQTGTIKVVIPQFKDPNGVMPESNVYAAMENYMFNQTGKKLVIESVPLSRLADADPALLHMVGINEVKLEDAERKAVNDYIASGGTVLIENLGGTGKFVESIRDQMADDFARVGGEDKVGTRADIITGRNLPEGAKNNRRVVYRRMVLERSNPDTQAMLRGYAKADRYPVLNSYEDISLGMLGVKQYGINGYSVDSARDLMLNVLLEAEKVHPGSTSQ